MLFVVCDTSYSCREDIKIIIALFQSLSLAIRLAACHFKPLVSVSMASSPPLFTVGTTFESSLETSIFSSSPSEELYEKR